MFYGLVQTKMATARLTFISLLKQSNLFGYKTVSLRSPYVYATCLRREFTNVPLEFNDKDPAPLFFSQNVQSLLKYITRPEVDKVFRKRVNKNERSLSVPQYKFMTDKELKEEMDKVTAKVDHLLQMPPAIKINNQVDHEVSSDPAVRGHDLARYVFTDITFGISNSERFIVIREPDGRLHHADHAMRKKLNQIYFPMPGRTLKDPAMFTEDSLFQDLLTRKEYTFLLDRACIQYEPSDPAYQQIVSKVYLNIDETRNYQFLRSTRHFGPMAFFLAWNNIIDGLVLEILQSGDIREVVSLIHLQQRLHPETFDASDSQALVDQILMLRKPITQGSGGTADSELDAKCAQRVARYIQSNSTMKGQQELALQAYQQIIQEKIRVGEKVREAHGV